MSERMPDDRQTQMSDEPETTVHTPVMPSEIVEWLAPRAGGRYVDGTLGGAGHTMLLLEVSAPDGRVLAIDADARALERAQSRLADVVASRRLVLRQGNFARM